MLQVNAFLEVLLRSFETVRPAGDEVILCEVHRLIVKGRLR